mmetsp:Transcript_11794/g.18587  ORF Transcript_11794/g.18587 Transcript_11794/m.18587 type:complete len:203 (-) Transcript_11794:66-674(-)
MRFLPAQPSVRRGHPTVRNQGAGRLHPAFPVASNRLVEVVALGTGHGYLETFQSLGLGPAAPGSLDGVVGQELQAEAAEGIQRPVAEGHLETRRHRLRQSPLRPPSAAKLLAAGLLAILVHRDCVAGEMQHQLPLRLPCDDSPKLSAAIRQELPQSVVALLRTLTGHLLRRQGAQKGFLLHHHLKRYHPVCHEMPWLWTMIS